MNVGQVEFSVASKTLDEVLRKATALQEVLNNIDGKSYGGKGGSMAKGVRDARDYRNRIRNEVAKEEKRYAIRQRNERLKEQKRTYIAQARMEQRHRLQTKKDQEAIIKDRQAAERKYATWEHAQKKKEAAAAAKEQEKAQKTERQQQKESYLAAARMAYREREQKKKEAADARKAEQISITEQSKARAEFQRDMQQQIVNAGAQLQTLGATMQRISSPFADVFRGVAYGIGYRLLGKVTDSISGAFSRYDTMYTYDKVLKQIGIDADKKFSVGTGKAKTAIDNLNDSVLGLPTGLDEIVASMRVYAGMTNDIEKATKIAIAANNAFIAGGESETRQRMAERQIQNMLSNGELTAQQWNSLQKNMAVGFNAVAKEMGYADKDVGKLLADMKSGKHTVDEFLNAFMKVGTEGSIKNAAEEMKQTWSAVAQNMQNAISRAGEGILKTLNTVFEATDGRNFLQHILGVDKNGEYIEGKGIRGVIDGLAKSAKSWIKANPDKILKFFDSLKKIDIKSIAGGFATFGISLGRFYAGIARVVGKGGFIKFMLGMNLAGRLIQNFGGLMKGTSWLTSRLATRAVFGKGSKAAAEIVSSGKGMEEAAKQTASVALSWQQVASKGINVLSIGVVAGAIKLIASAFVDIGRANVDFGKLTEFAIGAAGFIAEFAGLSQLLGAKGALTGIAQLSRLFGEIEIGIIAHDISAVAKALSDVSTVDMPKKDKLKKVLNALGDFAAALPSTDMFSAIGKFFSSKAVSSTARAVSNVTSAIKSVNSLKGNLKKFRKAMFGDADPDRSSAGGAWGDSDSIVGIMEDMLHTFDNNDFLKTFTESWKSSNIAKVFESLASMMTNFSIIAGTKINSKRIQKATENITELSNSISPLLEAFSDMYSSQFGTTSAQGKTRAEVKGADAANRTISSTYGAQAQGFAKMMEYLDSTLQFAGKIMNKLNKMKAKIDTLKENFGGEGTNFDFSPIGDVLTGITGMFDAAGVSAGDYSLAPDNMEYIDTAMDSLDSIVEKMNRVKEQILAINEGNTGGFFDIGAQIGTIVSDLIASCSRAPELEASVSMLSSAIGVLKGALDKINGLSADYTAKVANIKSAIDQLSQLGTKSVLVAVTIDGKITDNVSPEILKAATAIENAKKLILPVYETSSDVNIKLGIHTDQVSSYIASVASRIRRAIDNIPTSVNKTVTVNIRRRTSDNPGRRVTPYTGGRIGGRVQYRAHGGSIFKPRGTDTIPAMLTEGEYVMNHMASNAIGYDVLQKLNHLDIAGAIKGLYAKVGTSTVNNTKNASVTVNNYGAPSVGFAKASRWVGQL